MNKLEREMFALASPGYLPPEEVWALKMEGAALDGLEDISPVIEARLHEIAKLLGCKWVPHADKS